MGTLLAGASTTSIDHQDITRLVAGPDVAGRAHAFLVPNRLGQMSAVDLAYSAEEGARVTAERKAAEMLARRMAMVAEGDEGRVLRAGKAGRVVAQRPANEMSRFGLAAGSIFDGKGIVGPRVTGGEARIRTAFAKISDSTRDSVAIAASFQLMGPPKFDKRKDTRQAAEDKVMLASLKPSDDTGALGYAPADGGTAGRASSMFERVLKDQPEAFIPPIDDDDHAWAATPLPKEAMSESEQTCLANGIYFEARGESSQGQAAVAQVILNRVRNPAYPNTICGVVYQNKNWRNRCQFSFACDGHKDRIRDAGAYTEAEDIAKKVTTGEIWIAEVGSATHYHANYVRPRWARAMEKVDKIGRHIFYRTYNGGL
ncbi:cell wall hydrolase [Jiella avicenniae]|uniref:Cell wall hydrolase n=1 Tax=Jiella avicenniae TaxID=2907202 RepID=A0A9X1TE42_9HYPH|nr:cell wall hydrolase [Jiella avicenniae]MCE7030898.1 cell wall hydrolase [Jiella avicenniae]